MLFDREGTTFRVARPAAASLISSDAISAESIRPRARSFPSRARIDSKNRSSPRAASAEPDTDGSMTLTITSGPSPQGPGAVV